MASRDTIRKKQQSGEVQISFTEADLKRIHVKLFSELSKELDYDDDETFKNLTEDNDLSKLKIFGATRMKSSRIRQTMMKRYDEVSEELGKRFREAEVKKNQKEVPWESKWTAIASLRTAILAAKMQEFSQNDNSSTSITSTVKYFPFLPYIQTLMAVDGKLRPVVVREEDIAFWTRCVDRSVFACGVGVSGIGKTTTTFVLLQKLIMEKKKPVVYAVKSSTTVYFEFVPKITGDVVDDIQVTCRYNERGPSFIDCLRDEDAYYVVDPGISKECCLIEPSNLNAHFILICGCDDRHWGENAFEKLRSDMASAMKIFDRDIYNYDHVPAFCFGNKADGEKRNEAGGEQAIKVAVKKPMKRTVKKAITRADVGGFVYCASWSLNDVLLAKTKIGLGKVTDDEIRRRYRMVGGDIGQILYFKTKRVKKNVARALSGLDEHTMRNFADGVWSLVFKPDWPRKLLVSVEPEAEDREHFELVFSSDYVEERLAEKILKMSWFRILEEENWLNPTSRNRGTLFEALVRFKLSQMTLVKPTLQSLPTLPSNAGTKNKNYVPNSQAIRLGSTKRTIVRVAQPHVSVKGASMEELFYSKDESETFMMLRVEDGYVAVRATLQKSHNASPDRMEDLVRTLALKHGERLRIIYVVPKSRLEEFATVPVNPLQHVDPGVANMVEIYHLGIDGSEAARFRAEK